jgi:hypothetical protein
MVTVQKSGSRCPRLGCSLRSIVGKYTSQLSNHVTNGLPLYHRFGAVEILPPVPLHHHTPHETHPIESLLAPLSIIQLLPLLSFERHNQTHG